MLNLTRWTRNARGRRRPPAAGFTLVEIIVALSVVSMLAGVVVWQVTGRMGGGQAAVLARTLDSLGRALNAFRIDVRRYPGTLVSLSNRPGAGTLDTCGNTIPTRFLNEWQGPYVDRTISTSGIVSGNATIQVALQRIATPPDTVIRLVVDGVDEGVANQVERALDATVDLNAGTVRWVVGSIAGRGALHYHIPSRGC